ncbi:MAG: hypothetical protein ACM3JB_02535 [Acidobacteriaceae bacterium]
MTNERNRAIGSPGDRAIARQADRRPVAVVVVAGFLFLATVIAVFVGGSILFPNALMDRMWEWNKPGTALFQTVGKAAGAFLLALAAGTCAAGFGLLKRQRWAWWFAVVLFVVDVSGDVISVFVTSEVLRSVVGVMMSGVFLSMLLKRGTRKYFFATG